ncbi:MAG TPA: hypothetical protein VFT84_02095, partial [Gemmatimonadales bacterium]|nr:hypothetical protein [Gemmatimonadales bacterium]
DVVAEHMRSVVTGRTMEEIAAGVKRKGSRPGETAKRAAARATKLRAKRRFAAKTRGGESEGQGSPRMTKKTGGIASRRKSTGKSP